MLTVDFTATIRAIDAAITSLSNQLVAGTTPVGVQSLSVAGRTISYTDPADALEKLVELKLKFIGWQNRLSGSSILTRGVVGGKGRW